MRRHWLPRFLKNVIDARLSVIVHSEEDIDDVQAYIKSGKELFMIGEDEESYDETLGNCKELLDIGVQGITPLIFTPYPGTEAYRVCEKFGWLAYEDDRDVLTTVSYAAMNPGRVQIKTPWCSQKRAFKRWKYMMRMFPTYHNVRKVKDEEGLLTGRAIRNRWKKIWKAIRGVFGRETGEIHQI